MDDFSLITVFFFNLDFINLLYLHWFSLTNLPYTLQFSPYTYYLFQYRFYVHEHSTGNTPRNKNYCSKDNNPLSSQTMRYEIIINNNV